MLDKVKPLTENDQLILQQLIENLAQQSEQNNQMNVDSSDEQQDNRSETPFSQNDTEPNEEAEIEENGHNEENGTQSPIVIEGNVAVEMSRQLQFVGHQLVKLLCGIGQTPCTCNNCATQLKKNIPAVKQHKKANELDLNVVNQMAKQLTNANGANTNGPPIEFNDDGSLKRGRRSKYCTAAEKQEVADYADQHGATAAARKFDIPASVAAYYHRKLKKGFTGPGGSAPRRPQFAPYTTPGMEPKAVDGSRQQSLDTNGDETENQQRSFTYNNGGGIEDYGKSPGAFLRGRGRGRPKLIGDELDAELVEFMVDVKSKLPRAHLTASHALEVARAYILEKAPQILEENGGHINLKITWAMKLVSRTNERWREIHGGPPSPTMFDASNTSLLQINSQLNEFIAQFSNQGGQNGATSEITNIRELQFPFNLQNNQEMDDEENNDEEEMEKPMKADFIVNEGGQIAAE